LLKSIGAVCPDWNCVVAGDCDEKLDPAGGLYINQLEEVAAAGSDRCWDVSPATNCDDFLTVAGTVPLALGIGLGG